MTNKAQHIMEKIAEDPVKARLEQSYMNTKKYEKKLKENKMPTEQQYMSDRKKEVMFTHEHPVKDVLRGLGRSMGEGAVQFGGAGAVLGTGIALATKQPRMIPAIAGSLGAGGAVVGAAAGGVGHLIGAGIATPIVRHFNKEYVNSPKKMHSALKKEYKDTISGK